MVGSTRIRRALGCEPAQQPDPTPLVKGVSPIRSRRGRRRRKPGMHHVDKGYDRKPQRQKAALTVMASLLGTRQHQNATRSRG